MVSGNNNHGKTNPQSRNIHINVRRQDGPNKPNRWEMFKVPVDPGANVISCLQWIAEHPVTADGKKTKPVVWDANCLEEVCGACTMLINGKVRQSCSCLIDEYAPNDGDTITLEPMTKYPIVRDLWVDRSRIFETLKKAKAWVPIDGTYDLGPGPKVVPEFQQIRYKISECMSCGCCMEACPQYLIDNNFVGAAPIGQIRLFNAHPTGKVLKDERLDMLMGPGGIDDCGNAQNCVKACPKEIPLTEAIPAIGRQMTAHAVKKFFSGR